MSDLLPCPFCGGVAVIEGAAFAETPKDQLVSARDRFSTGYWIACGGDGCPVKIGHYEAYDDCEGGWFSSIEEATEFWNKRA